MNDFLTQEHSDDFAAEWEDMQEALRENAKQIAFERRREKNISIFSRMVAKWKRDRAQGKFNY